VTMKARRKRLQRWLRRGSAALLILGPPAAIALWLAFEHKPGWYRPAEVTEDSFQRAQADTATLAEAVSQGVVAGGSFEVSVAAGAVNEWLACLPRLLPEEDDLLPPGVSRPAVQFTSKGLRVGADVHYRGWRAILSVGLTVSISDDGQTVRIALTDVRGGSLPVPRAALARALEPLLQSGIGSDDAGRSRPGSPKRMLQGLKSVDDLYGGVTLRNRFVWPNGERPFRLEAISFEEGAVRVRLDPL